MALSRSCTSLKSRQLFCRSILCRERITLCRVPLESLVALLDQDLRESSYGTSSRDVQYDTGSFCQVISVTFCLCHQWRTTLKNTGYKRWRCKSNIDFAKPNSCRLLHIDFICTLINRSSHGHRQIPSDGD